MSSPVIKSEPPDQPDVLALLEASDRYHTALYPAESNHLVDVASLMAPDVSFFVARLADKAVGCGAVLLGDEDGVAVAELKRMWVDPTVRGHGLGSWMLRVLEDEAVRLGASAIRLETGIAQPEAIALYQSRGYRECEPFGSYQPDPLSLFMEKRISAL